ncbi:MAG TPA: accessory factor UbiK family protein [Thiobacillaceae bacterium]|nr:accessory factor UbiK family protein [Thiobacillaceae bacterium]
MLNRKLADELVANLGSALAMSPARDMEKNLRAGVAVWLAKLDLVTREEFDVQTRVLAGTRERLQALEERLARLEADKAP